MKVITTTIEIDVPADKVWAALIDLARYPLWNPFLQEVKGNLRHGGRLSVRARFPGAGVLPFHPRVVNLGAGELSWRGGLPVPGLVDGFHRFAVEPLSPRRTRFAQDESFSGVLVPLLWPFFAKHLHRGFVLMNAALKGYLEGYG